MPARPSALLLVVLALPAPARAEPASVPCAAASEAGPEGVPSLCKLRALLLDRLPGLPLEVPSSPRYLALQEPNARGTRVLIGWALPGLTAADLPELRALTDALSASMRALTLPVPVPFDAAVSLDTGGEAPLVVVELSSSRPAASRTLEAALLEVISKLGAPAEGPGRVAAFVRAKLRPLARAVVEIHGPEVAAAVTPAKRARHLVERGDTLSQIARAYGLGVEELAKLNGLDVTRPIRPGDELQLSARRPPRPKLYVVEQGDSLAKVARRFGVSEKALLEVNRLESHRLSRGQKLVLPR